MWRRVDDDDDDGDDDGDDNGLFYDEVDEIPFRDFFFSRRLPFCLVEGLKGKAKDGGWTESQY